MRALLVPIVFLAPLLWTEPSYADQRTDPTHVAAEYANCLAQHKCPTATPTNTGTPTPTLTPVPSATFTPTGTPQPDTPTATPQPSLPVPPDTDDPLGGYTRPSVLDDDRVTLELALPQGRWEVGFADESCAPRPWSDVKLEAGALVGGCALSSARWQSDVACAMDDDGLCSVLLDASFWDMLAHTPTAEPTSTSPPPPATSTSQPAPRSAASRQVAAIAAAPAPPPAAPRILAPTARPTPTFVEPTATPVPATPTAAPTQTPTPTAAPAALTPTGVPSSTPQLFDDSVLHARTWQPDVSRLPSVVSAGLAGALAIGAGLVLMLMRIAR